MISLDENIRRWYNERRKKKKREKGTIWDNEIKLERWNREIKKIDVNWRSYDNEKKSARE